MQPWEIFLRTAFRKFAWARTTYNWFQRKIRLHELAREKSIHLRRMDDHQVAIHIGKQQLHFRSDSARDLDEAQSLREGRFISALFKLVKPGDVVWDVGANVGFYTVLLSQAVGNRGLVWAFEPNPTCYEKLVQVVKLNSLPNCHLIPMALGATEGRAYMEVTHENSPTARIVPSPTPWQEDLRAVNMMPGDAFREREHLPIPQVIKVDVEGWEDEVIQGLTGTLKHLRCRALLCEIHFQVLNSRGKRYAPIAIEKRLRSFGFSRVCWPDRSHLIAVRG